jgi:hypothetical protein
MLSQKHPFSDISRVSSMYSLRKPLPNDWAVPDPDVLFMFFVVLASGNYLAAMQQ